MDLYEYASSQLNLKGTYQPDFVEQVLKAVSLIDDQCHSGFSIGFLIRGIKTAVAEPDPYGYAITQRDNCEPDFKMTIMLWENISEVVAIIMENECLNTAELTDVITTLAAFDPLVPITDEEENWELFELTYQHQQKCSIFKDVGSNKPYYMDAIYFREQNGRGWRSGDSSLYIDLPIECKNLPAFEIKVDDECRCLNEEEFEKYMQLVPRMVTPLIELRRPK